jgi:hypothetical protein
MNTTRKVAIVAGVLLITAWVTGAVCMGLTNPVLDAPDYLTQVSANANQITIGALLYFMMAVAGAGIALSLYPVLVKLNAGLAIGAVGLRIMEGAIYLVGVVAVLSLLTLSQQFVKAGAPSASSFQTLGDSLLAVNEQVNVVGMSAFSIGALMYYYIFYRSKLIPQWLSGWGLVGALLALVASAFVMLRFISPLSPPQIIAYLPIGLQELVLGVWLIVKGFDPAAMPLESPKTEITASQLITSKM